MAILRIELLEDCEMNSGRVVNTYYADDVFFDGFGLPFIPAWIVRNSFVKAIEESPSRLSEDEVEALVGRHATLILDDALIADRESMRQAVLSNEYGGVLLRNPHTVLDASGFVKERNDHTMGHDSYVRMLAKGVIYEAYFELEEPYFEALETLVEMTHALYVGHKAYAHFTIDRQWERPRFEVAEPKTDWTGEWSRLEYDLHVISHMTSFDHTTGEISAHPYVSGDEIRDALSQRANLSGVFAQRGCDVRCSYAYIDACGHRGLPIPASYSTKKQDKNDLRDRCSVGRRADDFDQIKGVGSLFIDDPDSVEIHALGVRKEQAIVQYYLQGAFKSVPYCAVGRSQTFKGFIEGPTESVRRIYDSVLADGYIRVGHLSNLGFGNAYVQVTSVAPIKNQEPVFAEEITVLLASPARLYRGGIYEVSAQNVLEEVEAAIGGNVELEIVRNSQKTCRVSTFNKVWHELEPLEYAMEAGSIYRMRAKNGAAFDISSAMGGVFIGEHNDVGYGETWILPAVDVYYRKISYSNLSEGMFPLSYKVDPNPGRRLMRSLYQKNADTLASYMGSAAAEEFVREEFSGVLDEIRATICSDFDLEQAFETYLDSLKESGLNAIRRSCRD